MGRIQSSVGLITGVPITQTVDQLIALKAKPRDLLLSRTQELQQQQVAVGELTALTIAIQLASDKLGATEIFETKQANSSNPDLLSAQVTGDPAPGIYQFTPVRQAQNHQVVSQGFASLDDPVGSGSFTLQRGGFVDQPLELSQLNGGDGVQRGKIRITDRSGVSQVIDLSKAQTVDDVLSAINGNDFLNVVASVNGDQIVLDDLTGQTTSNLQVQDLGLGTTAADLGLANIDVAADTATGTDIVSLFDGLDISVLNGGNGVGFQRELADLQVTVGDGTQLSVDFQAGTNNEKTLGDLVETINAVDPTKLRAEISADGERIQLVDLSGGGGTLQVQNLNGSSVVEDLGLTNAASGGVLAGNRLVGGLKTTLLSTLSGGQGLGTLGQISITDRSGASATVDLSSAETLDDVTNLLNASGLAIEATTNGPRNGIQIRDTSGATASNLIISNADATNTAAVLGLEIDDAVTVSNSGSLNRQYISAQTRLDDLNGGKGVDLSSFLITDTAGVTSGVNLLIHDSETVGDVIDAINGLGIGVQAEINATGDGIRLVDTIGGSGDITVAESGSGSSAADLNLLGTSQIVDIGGTPTKVIDGSTREEVSITGSDTLQDVVDKINDLDAGVIASIINDGSSTPYRLSLVSQVEGRKGELLLDSSLGDFQFQEIVAPQDALVLIGSANSPGAGLLASSSSNEFEQLIEGVTLTVNGTSNLPVTIQVDESDTPLLDTAELFVSSYNKLVEKLDAVTFFNEADLTTGILFGSHETLRVESDLANLVSGRIAGAGSITSLEAVGISLGENGQLDLDADKLAERFAEDPDAVKEFFTHSEFGVSARFKKLIDTLAGEENSLLLNRNNALQDKIDDNNDRIETLTGRLDRERERLLLEFYRLEESIAKIQSNLSVVQSLASLAAPATSSGTGISI